MRRLHRLGLCMGFAVLASCGAGADTDIDAAAGAPFRQAARETYRALQTGSCPPRPEFARERVLAPEIAAMRAFEGEMRARPAAAAQLAVAREDIAYLQRSGTLGCWADKDRDFAQIHVRMAREAATEGLGKLRQMAPTVSPGSGIPPVDTPRAAAFRAEARALAELLAAPCELTSQAPNDTILEEARRRVAAFRSRLAGSPYAAHFAIAEADVAYAARITIVDCADPGTEAPDAIARTTTRETEAQIEKLDRLTKG